ncbi:MAG TPA: glycosyltransferase family 4 protein [Jatrophihabitans sp.]
MNSHAERDADADCPPSTHPSDPPSIALLGPVAPYRGGIAQYTMALREALQQQTDVRMISFARQYPGWLYPGDSDIDASQPDRDPSVAYLIDNFSPLSWRRAADEVVASGCRVAILSWWTLYWHPAFGYIARRLRKHGVKVIYLCHNLSDHGVSLMRRRISETFSNHADAYVVHTDDIAERLAQIRPGIPVLTRQHPVYAHFPAPSIQPKQRGRLELLFFGMVRPHKGLDVLLEALGSLQDEDVHLTVVGDLWGDSVDVAELITRSQARNVDLDLQFVSPQAAANYFARADVVVLPYRSATGSGVAALAYHYNKPVLATAVGGLTDQVVDGKTGWLVEPASPTALARAIAGLRRDELAEMTLHIQRFKEENSWSSMATAVLDLISSL